MVSLCISGIRETLKIAKTRTFAKYGINDTHPNLAAYPFCAEYTYGTTAFWDCFVRHFSLSFYHASSTCRMGRKDDPKAVVDSTLR